MALYLTIALLVFVMAIVVACCLLSKRGEARAIESYRLHHVAKHNPKFFL